jgi:beta-galactosidase/beta-glucuronidase
MTKIVDVDVQTRRADPMEAEIVVSVTAVGTTPSSEVRGRCVGPKCPGRTTVEVAYPLRRVPGQGLTARVVIPEPSLWSESQPAVYDIIVELWQEGTCIDQHALAGYRVVSPRRR